MIDTTYPVSDGPEGLVSAIDRVCKEAVEAAKSGNQVIVLSDKRAGPDRLVGSSLFFKLNMKSLTFSIISFLDMCFNMSSEVNTKKFKPSDSKYVIFSENLDISLKILFVRLMKLVLLAFE